MTHEGALAFVEEHGIVLESAQGPVPSLASVIAGEEIRGSWWGHAEAEQIWILTRRLRESEDVLVCRLVGGKVTYVHRRLWPALSRLADRFSADRIAKVTELHTERGHHSVSETPFPAWASPSVLDQADSLSEAAAIKLLGIEVPGEGAA